MWKVSSEHWTPTEWRVLVSGANYFFYGNAGDPTLLYTVTRNAVRAFLKLTPDHGQCASNNDDNLDCDTDETN